MKSLAAQVKLATGLLLLPFFQAARGSDFFSRSAPTVQFPAGCAARIARSIPVEITIDFDAFRPKSRKSRAAKFIAQELGFTSDDPRVIGTGSQGIVIEGRRRLSNGEEIPVVLKVLLKGDIHEASEQAALSFLANSAIAQVDSPHKGHVASIYEFFDINGKRYRTEAGDRLFEDSPDDGRRPVDAPFPVFVMEHAGLTSLSDLLEQKTSAYRIAEISLQTAQALHAVHSAGVVHRDIKPPNIMVRPDGLVQVIDFGVAAWHGILTHPAGSAIFCSPNQLRSILDWPEAEDANQLATPLFSDDLYALAATIEKSVLSQLWGDSDLPSAALYRIRPPSKMRIRLVYPRYSAWTLYRIFGSEVALPDDEANLFRYLSSIGWAKSYPGAAALEHLVAAAVRAALEGTPSLFYREFKARVLDSEGYDEASLLFSDLGLVDAIVTGDLVLGADRLQRNIERAKTLPSYAQGAEMVDQPLTAHGTHPFIVPGAVERVERKLR